MKCPKCGNDKSFNVQGSVRGGGYYTATEIYEDGKYNKTEEETADYDVDIDERKCAECDHEMEVDGE